MEQEMKPLKLQAETVVSAFVISYGLHYLGYFLRIRYFNFIGTLQISEGVSHVFGYLGHVIFLAMLLLYALAVEKDRKYIMTFLTGKGKKNLSWFLLGAATGFVLMGICILAASLHGDISVGKGSGAGAGLFVFGFIAVLIQASVEEIESRAFLFGKMKGEGVSLVTAILASAFFFSYIHMTNPGFGFVPFLCIFIVGIQYACAYHYFGNIWFVCGVHALWNFSQDFIFGLPDSGKPAAVSIFGTTVNGSGFFYDSVFGIEGGWMAICLNAAVCAAIILAGRKHARSKTDAAGKTAGKFKGQYFGFDLTHGDRLECYDISRLPSGDYEIFVQAGSRVTGYSNTWTLKKEETEGKTFEELIALFPLSGILWDVLRNDEDLKKFLGF